MSSLGLPVIIFQTVLVLALGPANKSSDEPVFQQKTLSQWKAQWNDADRLNRLLAIKAVVEMGPRAVPAMAEALSHRDQDVRYWAAVGLGNQSKQAKPATTALRKALTDSSPSVRVHAAYALFELGYEQEAMASLLQSLQHSQSCVRIQTVWALNRLGPKAHDALPALKKCLQDDDDYVVRSTGHAIKALGGQQ